VRVCGDAVRERAYSTPALDDAATSVRHRRACDEKFAAKFSPIHRKW